MMAKITTPCIVHEKNLSLAWGKMVLALLKVSGGEISPALVSITGFDADGNVEEDADIREELNRLLTKNNETSVEQVAFTIFPQRLWTLAQGDREYLYSLYRRSFVSYRRKPANRCGMYFQRMTMLDPDDESSHNQLEYIITRYSNKRAKGQGAPRMHLVASIHDPKRDHGLQPVPGFPCMQQVSFCPTDNGLVVNATYATQQAMRKAYGNFLGLAHLARFMAAEMGLPLAQLNVMIGVEKIGGNKFPKASLAPFAELIKKKVENGT